MSKEKQKDLLQQWLNFDQDKTPESDESRLEGPLTPGQERLYILQELYPENPFYHYTEVYNFLGPIQVDELVQAFKKTVALHPILQTQFLWEGDSVIQRIRPGLEPTIQTYSQQESLSIEEWKKISARTPFDLSDGSPVRLGLIIHDSNKVECVVTMHHIVTDKWSMRKFREDWAHFYQLEQGKPSDPPPQGMRYLDYAIQKTKEVTPEVEVNYWKENLADLNDPLPLEGDLPRPKKMSFSGAFEQMAIPENMAQGVKRLASELETTPYTIYLAAFKLLLLHQTGVKDIVVGSPFSNRNSEDLEHSIGFFNETVLLRSKIDLQSSIAEFIEYIKTTTLNAFSHSRIAFEELVKILNPERRENINPLFQVMFLYHDVPAMSRFHPDISVHYAPYDLGVAKFDLTLYVSNDHGRHEVIIEYSDEIFIQERIKKMLQQYLHFLEHLMQNKQAVLQEIPPLPHVIKSELMRWSSGEKISVEGHSILDHLENYFQNNNGENAAWSEDSILSYPNLDEKSRALAQALIAQGLQKGEGVLLMTEPRVEFLIGLVGILRAGGYYIPIDPAYPKERIEFIIRDTNARFVLHDGSWKVRDNDINSIHLLHPPDSVSRDLPQIVAEDTAYMIYTSGSTGKPKGVKVHHGALLNSTAARITYYGNSTPRYLLLSSFSFDSSIAGIFWCLYTGGTIILTPKRIEQDLPRLEKIITQSKATHTLMLPSLYAVLLDHVDRSSLQSLEHIIVAGEACPPSLIDLHKKALPKAQLHNEYGPTESTVWASVAELRTNEMVTIGQPIANVNTWILDPSGELCAPGVPGELYISGKNLTHGYHQREDLTQEKFVPLPDLDIPLAYRTGDLVKWNHQGQMVFLGRVDNQIKVRGYRIELDEITNVILEKDGIHHAITIINELKQIRSFYAPSDISPNVLRIHLEARLPGYMIPDDLIALGELPRLPNGKIDRKKLSQLVAVPSEPVDNALLTPKEKLLKRIWEEVIGHDQFSIKDNFFAIGGDSIKSIQVIAKLREHQFELKPQDLFTYQSISKLASHLKDMSEETHSFEPVVGTSPWLPIHHWFFSTHKNQPQHWGQAYAISIDSNISGEQVHSAFQKILIHHDALRAHFDLEDETIIVPNYTPLEIDNFSESDPTEYLREWMTHSSLEEGPLFRCALNQEENRVILSGHHLIVDALSWPMIIRDFIHFLNHEKPRSPKSTSYLDWCRFVYDNFKDEYNQTQSDHPAILEKEVSAEEIIITYPTQFFDAEKGNAIHLNKDELAFLGAYLIHGSMVQSDQAMVSIESHGRLTEDTNYDLSHTVGWFTTMYNFSPDHLSLDPANMDMLKKFKESFRSHKKNALQLGVCYEVPPMKKNHFVFNYLGHMTSAESGDNQPEFLVEGVRSPDSERTYLYEMNVYDEDGKMKYVVSGPKDEVSQLDIQSLTEQVQNKLNEVFTLLENTEKQYTPSDFTDVDLSQDDLDALLEDL